MPFAQRDPDGTIVALFRQPRPGADEPLASDDAEVLAFLRDTVESEREVTERALGYSDTDVSRVVEDLIELLVRKNVIMFSELPQPAQQKLLRRRRLRSDLADDDSESFLHDEDLQL